MIYICMLALLLLSGCHNITLNQIDYQDFDCHSVDMRPLVPDLDTSMNVSCGLTWHFDAPWGHKFEGEK